MKLILWVFGVAVVVTLQQTKAESTDDTCPEECNLDCSVGPSCVCDCAGARIAKRPGGRSFAPSSSYYPYSSIWKRPGGGRSYYYSSGDSDLWKRGGGRSFHQATRGYYPGRYRMVHRKKRPGGRSFAPSSRYSAYSYQPYYAYKRPYWA